MTIKLFNAGDAEIAYELTGPAGAPVVVLRHGRTLVRGELDANWLGVPAFRFYGTIRAAMANHPGHPALIRSTSLQAILLRS